MVAWAEGRNRVEYQRRLGRKVTLTWRRACRRTLYLRASGELGLLCLDELPSFRASSEPGQSLTRPQGMHSCAWDDRANRPQG